MVMVMSDMAMDRPNVIVRIHPILKDNDWLHSMTAVVNIYGIEHV